MKDYACSKCGSRDLHRDATARWDADDGAWVMCGLQDNVVCDACGAENETEEDEVKARRRVVIRCDGDADAPGDDLVRISYSKESRYVLGTEPLDAAGHVALRRRIDSGDVIAVPVYAYVHGGSTVAASDSGNPFHCPWDSGLSGYAYVERAAAEREIGGRDCADGTVDELARRWIVTQVEAFGQYLRGEVYGVVEEECAGGGWEHLDSCWGYYGIEYARKEAEAAAECHRRNGYECEVVEDL